MKRLPSPETGPKSALSFEDSGLAMLVAVARRGLKHAIEPLLTPLNLTAQQAWALLMLRRVGPLSLTDLARYLGLDAPSMSRLVHHLKARNILHVEPDPTHARRLRIGIAPEGHALAETLYMASETFRDRLEKGFTEEEKATLCGYLWRLIENLNAMGEPEPKTRRAKAS
ncbi:MAG: MarR family transcriptional regulator [Firmicutes bacterium]|nr:MarR family transcriptional regulator [Bacillota bacterium]